MQIGDKVISLIDFIPNKTFLHPYGEPLKDNIYVIKGFIIKQNMLGLKLIGLKTIQADTNEETGWAADKFRKLDDIKEINQLKRELEKIKTERF